MRKDNWQGNTVLKVCLSRQRVPVVNAFKRLSGWVNKPFALNRELLT